MARTVLGQYHADPRIVFVEIQNEMNPASARAMGWAQDMIPFVRTMSDLPIAVSARGDLSSFLALTRALRTSAPDIFSFHFFAAVPGLALRSIYWAQRIAAPTPLFVGEAGFSTGLLGSSASDPTRERAQDLFFRAVESATQYLGLPPAAPWTFRDFAAGTLCSCAPGAEYHFGLIRTDGTVKPAFTTLARFFKLGLISR